MTAHQTQQRLIESGLIIDHYGLGDLTRGHVSIRVPGDPEHFYMKPHSFGFDEITPENMVLCNLDGEKVGGTGRKHSEVYIHSEIYKSRPDVNSVIHAHPTYAVAFSATGKNLQPISQPSVAFADGLPYFDEAIDLIRTPELGLGVANSLGQCKAVLMRNHGVSVVGSTVEEATILLIMLENACQIQLAAMSAGVGETFDAVQIKKLHHDITRPEQYTINFDYLVRKIKRLQHIN
ncbi:class II aldolase/adducin family protein [Limnohabitans sp.]|uniref:class II aldolase/adducin family protein n=1 Tax=Limnohabitans sp. TaxID=1907725 RepID=UPI00286EDCDF|nr:class II aldolase/adducin family protein [Limnohabitans sp.]